MNAQSGWSACGISFPPTLKLPTRERPPTNTGRDEADQFAAQQQIIMASKAVIPRFLLPLQGTLWRGVRVSRAAQNVRVRYASGDGKPIVLEKPAKFNPPSHGSRLKRNTLPKHYGPQLTTEEIAAQNKRHYPGMMAPEGSWSHWFWHSRLLHTFITMVSSRSPLDSQFGKQF